MQRGPTATRGILIVKRKDGDATQQLPPPGGAFRLRSHKIRIEVVGGPDRGLVADLPGPEARVGTGKECELVLTDPKVSRLHLVVRVEGDSIRIVDAGSTNGTILGGLSIRDACARPDSTLEIGASRLSLRMLDDFVDVPLSTREQMGGLIGRSVAMRRLFAVIERVASTDETVLIQGETGTGKELVAELLHEESKRASGPFVVFDCSAVSATLIESELFGHKRGAFTGAESDRAGAFEEADGGTLFLDEIGELPLDLQPKLLRALERRQVRRLGTNTNRQVDVRFLAATHRSLAREVERGKFREDLYYRLAVVEVPLPPLRERLDDVPLLLRHFEQQLARPGRALSAAARESFAARSWPGNVRELRNAVARALSLASEAGVAAGAPAPSEPEEPTIDLTEPLQVGRTRAAESFEKRYIEAALRQTGGNVTRAAELARVNRKFLQRAMIRCHLRGEPEPEPGPDSRPEEPSTSAT